MEWNYGAGEWLSDCGRYKITMSWYGSFDLSKIRESGTTLLVATFDSLQRAKKTAEGMRADEERASKLDEQQKFYVVDTADMVAWATIDLAKERAKYLNGAYGKPGRFIITTPVKLP